MAPDAELFERFDAALRRRSCHEPKSVECQSAAEFGAYSEKDAVLGNLGLQRPPLLPPGNEFVRENENPKENREFNDECTCTQWKLEWQKLGAHAIALQQEWRREVLCPRVLSGSYRQELENEMGEHANDGERWMNVLWGDLGHLRKRVACLKENVCRRAPITPLHALVHGMQRELEGFKTQQRQMYETLAYDEAELWQSLSAFERRCIGWEADLLAPSLHCSNQRPHSEGSCGSRSRAHSADSNSAEPLPCQQSQLHTQDSVINDIRKSLTQLDVDIKQAGGSTGGWSALHHNIFMRTFRMFKMQATPTFFVRLNERLPDKSDAELTAHAMWLADDEARQTQRRQLLHRWRERRAELECQQLLVEEELNSHKASQQQQLQERTLRQRAEQRKQIEAWRQMKAQEEERSAALQRGVEQDQILQHKRKRKQHAQQKEVVDTYRHQQELERLQAQEEKRQNEIRMRRALSLDDRRRIAQRNADMLQRKLQAYSSENVQATQPHALQGLHEHIDSRLHEPTKCFAHKKTHKVELSRDPARLAFTPRARAASAAPVIKR